MSSETPYMYKRPFWNLSLDDRKTRDMDWKLEMDLVTELRDSDDCERNWQKSIFKT